MLVVQPYDGAVIDDVPVDDAAAIERKLASAKQCFDDRPYWLPACKRIEILKRLARLVEVQSDTFALLIAREGGKPLTDARVETQRAVNGIEYAASEIERLAGDEIPMGLTPTSEDRWAFTTQEPIGVVVAISAFNHPLNLIVHQVVPAIATGCPVLIKPDAKTPLSCLRLVDLAYEAGLPHQWCQTVIVEDVKMAERLATDQRIAFLSFIGSAKTGWHLRSRLAPGTRCALEHGGVAPVIVDRSAQIDGVIGSLVKGGYYHAGQVCVSAQRIFVHKDLRDDFVSKFTEHVGSLKVGDPILPETEVGPLIQPKDVERVDDWVREAIDGGGHLVIGGERIGSRAYRPTIILEPPPMARISQEEVFGPVTCVYGFENIRDAIDQANSLPYAFQSSVFTRDLGTALTSAKLLEASAVMINDHTAFRTDWMPFAGRRQSGLGIGGIPYTMHDMIQDKMIVLNGSFPHS